MTSWTATPKLGLMQAKHPFLKFLATEMFWTFEKYWHTHETALEFHKIYLDSFMPYIGNLQVALLFDLTFILPVTHCEMRCGFLTSAVMSSMQNVSDFGAF